jgi:hypothetical protein
MMNLKKLINPWSLSIAVIHLVVSVTITFMSLGVTMARFDSGLPLSQIDQLIALVCELLNFPLVFLVSRIRVGIGIFGWSIFMFNSLLWGITIDRCGKLVQKISNAK